jgi:hypothetical protein
VETTESVADGVEKFYSFEVANCAIDSISINCINWVVTSTAEATTDFSDVGGYKNLAEGSTVKFWWWDGRDLDIYDNSTGDVAADAVEADADNGIEASDAVENTKDQICDVDDEGEAGNECAYEKMASSEDVTLKYDNAI